MPKKLPPMPAPNQLKFRQSLSIHGLLARVRKELESIKEHRIKTISYKLTDVLMSTLAIFGLKSPSLRQFDQTRHDELVKANLSNLSGVEKAPSDTPMREILDPVAPAALKPAFISRSHALRGNAGLGRSAPAKASMPLS